METQVVTTRAVARSGFVMLPTLITNAGERAGERFVEFFTTATIRNSIVKLRRLLANLGA
jgi:hypothetical protein